MKINVYQVTTKRPEYNSTEYWDLCDKLGTEHLKFGCADVIEKRTGTISKTELKTMKGVIAEFRLYDISSDCYRVGMMDTSERYFYEYAGKL